MSEETTEAVETTTETTPEVSTQETTETDSKISVGGQEYTTAELAEAKQNYDALVEQNEALHNFKEATFRLMDPNVDAEAKKRDAREILMAANYTPEQADEWVKIYDQEEETMTEESNTPAELQPENNQNAQETARMNEEILKMRAKMLQDNLEKQVSNSISSTKDGKLLMDWMKSNRSGEELNTAEASLTERVRAQAMENLRQRRNAAGTFDDSWVGEEVTRAAEKISADMLTVIGDPAKIGRVSETSQQAENLYRSKPTPLPETKGKTYGDIEGDLTKWTSDQLLKGLSDSGDQSKL